MLVALQIYAGAKVQFDSIKKTIQLKGIVDSVLLNLFISSDITRNNAQAS